MSTRPSYQIIAPTQQWRIIGGRIHRVYRARRSDGAVRLVAYPDTEVAA
jgi:hypothetical protein